MTRSSHKQKEHFNNIAEQYYNKRQQKEHLLFKKNLWEQFKTKFTVIAENTFYDCVDPMSGFGEGYEILRVLLDDEFSYVGYDCSEKVVEIVGKERPGINIQLGNILENKIDKTFDLVIVVGGLHHVYHDIGEALNTVNHLLKDEGLFISFEPTNNNFLWAMVRELIYRKNDYFHYETERAFKLDDYYCWIQSAGFTHIYSMYPGLLGYVLFYNPDAFPVISSYGKNMVNAICRAEKPLYATKVGKALSFATLSLWRKGSTFLSVK